jgi:peptide/nickel transport system permease protein
MTRYIIRRLLWVIVLLFFVSLLTFIIFYLVPATDPVSLRAGKTRDPQVLAAIRHQLGLDKSAPEQFWIYLKGIVLHFDFGHSYLNNTDVRSQILDRLPATASLAFGALVLWLLTSFVLGVVSAVRRGSVLDKLAMSGSLLGISAPVYWLGLVGLLLFAQDIGKIHIVPGAGSYVPLTKDPWGWFTSLILPWIVLSGAFAAIYARLLRSNMIETLGQDYIRTARAKGLSERRVVFGHALRSAVTPLVTLAGLDLGALLAGNAILTETVFNIPGVGRMSYDAIARGDLPVVQGIVLFGAFFIVVLNLIVDIAYAFLDPRVRYS